MRIAFDAKLLDSYCKVEASKKKCKNLKVLVLRLEAEKTEAVKEKCAMVL